MTEIILDCCGGPRRALADVGNGIAVHQERDGYHVTLTTIGQHIACLGDVVAAYGLAEELRRIHDWTLPPSPAHWLAATAAVRATQSMYKERP